MRINSSVIKGLFMNILVKKKLRLGIAFSYALLTSYKILLPVPSFFYNGEFDREAASKSCVFNVVEQFTVADGMDIVRFKSVAPHVVGYAALLDPKKIRFEAVQTRHQKHLEKISDMAKRKNALGAVNGSFYRPNRAFCANPAGTLKIEDTFYSDPQFSRGVIAWNKDGSRIYIGRAKVNWRLTIGKKNYRVDRINQPRGDGEAIIYNKTFSHKTMTHHQGAEITVVQGRVTKIARAEGNSSVPENGFVYSVHNAAGIDTSMVRIGAPVKITHSLSLIDAPSKEYERDNQKFDYIVGAGPTVLIKGIVSTFEQMNQELFAGKPLIKTKGEVVGNYHDTLRHRHWLIDKFHPRTAVGKRQDNTIVFVVVDGRLPGYSRGVNLYELGDIMKQFGCYQAINLDGGGASILHVEGKTINMLAGSDLDEKDRINAKGGAGIERPVGNGILFFKR